MTQLFLLTAGTLVGKQAENFEFCEATQPAMLSTARWHRPVLNLVLPKSKSARRTVACVES